MLWDKDNNWPITDLDSDNQGEERIFLEHKLKTTLGQEKSSSPSSPVGLKKSKITGLSLVQTSKISTSEEL